MEERGSTTVQAVLLSRKGIILVKNAATERKPEGFGLPGGGIKPEDESPHAAICREISEETGISDFEVGSEPLLTEKRGNHEVLVYFGKAHWEKRTPAKDPDILGCQVFDFNLGSLPRGLYSSHRERIRGVLKKLGWIDDSHPTKNRERLGSPSER